MRCSALGDDPPARCHCLAFGSIAKTTYPILPRVGVISLGFGITEAFILLRLSNVYGDKPWSVVEGEPVRKLIGSISLTEYPPSLLFLLPTLAGGALLPVLFERICNLSLVAAEVAPHAGQAPHPTG